MKEKSFQDDKTPKTLSSCCLGSSLSERHRFSSSLEVVLRRLGAPLNAQTAVCSDVEAAGLRTDIPLKFQSLETLIQTWAFVGGGGFLCGDVKCRGAPEAGLFQAVSEQSPSNKSEKPSVLEQDNVHVGVKQRRDTEGLSLAGLQEKTTNVSLHPSEKTFFFLLFRT